MGKKSQEEALGTYEQRVEAAKARQEEQRKKEAEQLAKAVTDTLRAQIKGPDVDMKPEEAIEKAISKHPQLSFRQKIDMMREMRRRRSHRKQEEKLTPAFSPTTELPEKKEEVKAVEETPKPVIQTFDFKCKDCGEKFVGMADEDMCIACSSKNIEKLGVSQKIESDKECAKA